MSTNKKNRLEPSNIILIAGLVLALLFAVGIIFLAQDSSDKVEDAVIEKMNVALSGQVHSIDLVVESHYATLKAIANHLEDEGGMEHLNHIMEWMDDIVAAGNFYRISVTEHDTDMTYYVDSTGSGAKKMDEDDEYYHGKIKNSMTWNINGPFVISGTDVSTVIITVPVMEGRHTVAIVAGMITVEDFMELTVTEGQGSDYSVYLVDSTGHIFVGSDKDKDIQIGGQMAEENNDHTNLVTRLKNHAQILKGSSVEQLESDLIHGKSGYMIFQADTYENYGKGYMVYENMSYKDWTMVYVKNSTAVAEEFSAIQNEGKMMIYLVIALCSVVMITTFMIYRRMYGILRRSNQELKKIAEKDFLTGLYSRGSMIDVIKQHLEEEHEGCHVLLLLDIDKFKYINDTLGHAAGDRALIAFAECMKTFFRKEDHIGRFGGDEFFVFLSNVKSIEGVISRLDSFKDIVEEKTCEKQWDILGCSIGVAIYPENAQTYEKLYRQADVAMYNSKKKEGICKITMYSDIEGSFEQK